MWALACVVGGFLVEQFGRTIEVVGLPGAGKTTLLKALKTIQVNEGSVVGRDGFSRPGMTRELFRQRATFLVKVARLLLITPHMLREMQKVDKLRVLRLLRVAILNHWNALEKLRHGSHVAQEGFVQKLLSICERLPEERRKVAVELYLGRAPLPEMVVWLETPPEICKKRIKHRVESKPHKRSTADFESLVKSSTLLLRELEERSMNLIFIDGMKDLHSQVSKLSKTADFPS